MKWLIPGMLNQRTSAKGCLTCKYRFSLSNNNNSYSYRRSWQERMPKLKLLQVANLEKCYLIISSGNASRMKIGRGCYEDTPRSRILNLLQITMGWPAEISLRKRRNRLLRIWFKFNAKTLTSLELLADAGNSSVGLPALSQFVMLRSKLFETSLRSQWITRA